MASRRNLLSAAAVLGLVPVAGASAPPAPSLLADRDAELIRLCAAFDSLERQLQHSYDGAETAAEEAKAEAAAVAIRQQQLPILNNMCAIPPLTLDGAAALAASFVLWSDCEAEDELIFAPPAPVTLQAWA